MIAYQVLAVHHYLAVSNYGGGMMLIQVVPNASACIELAKHDDTKCYLAEDGAKIGW